MRRFTQSFLLLGLCVTLGVVLGIPYLVLALIAASLALTSGVYIALALALGAVWPVLVVAYVAYVTSRAKQARALRGAASRSRATEPDLSRVEDAEHRQN